MGEGRGEAHAADEEAVPESVDLPITGELDLHAFSPRDIPAVVADYLDSCREHGIERVRLVHGRGQGVQRAIVRRVLSGRADVVGFDDAPPELGGWGATLVRMRPRSL
jgi:DNA-nicking Smr family endonuclease